MRISGFVFLAFILLSSQIALSQGDSQRVDTANYPYWVTMMQDPEAGFRATQSAFEKYWAGRSDYKGNGWKVFKRWEYINSSRVQADGKLPAPSYVANEYLRTQSSQKSMNGTWSQIGPIALPGNSTGQPNGLGRINAIGFHPSNGNIFFIGSPSGGFWKTADGGTTWSVLSAAMPTLGVSAILVHPAQTNIIWIGTGDRDAGDAPGMGVYKSIDDGVTWNSSNSGMGNQTVGMLIMHPSDPNIILAATNGGIYKTTNGGSTWTLKSSNSNSYKDIEFKPGDPTIVYATEGGKFYRSTNTGDTWTQITSGIVTGTRIVIAVTPANSSYVYLMQTNGSFTGVLFSTDSGLTFTTRATTPNIMDYGCTGSGTASQAWYDLCIAADPVNANTIYLGAINIWKSTDGGTTLTITSHWVGSSYGTSCAPSVHADIHTLDFSPVNGKLYTGCDGGIYSTSTGGTSWANISGGIAIAQVYKIGQSATNSALTMNGYQDNGTSINNGSLFTTVIGGDGMECIIDYINSNNRYGALYYGDIRRSSGGGYSTIAANGVNGITESGGWVTPYILHKTNPNTMFVGYKNVWRSTNVSAYPVVWTMISTGETSNCSVLEQSPANVDILYVVRSGQLKRSDNVNAASATWTSCTLPGGYTPTDLEAHPTNPEIIYATAQYGVYKSANRGLTWTNISYNLPSIYTNCLVYDKNSNEGLYVGNETSVYYKDATVTSWTSFSSGLPVLDIRELEIYYDASSPSNNRLKAATYGRGLWQSDLVETGVINPTGFTAAAISTTQINLTWIKNANNNNVMVAWSPAGTFGVPVTGTVYSAGNSIPGGGTVLYSGNGSSFNHTGLNPSTTYYYKAWSVNGAVTYSYGTAVNATTLCTVISSFPWNEGFTTEGMIPNCWSQADNQGNGQIWQFGTITGYTPLPVLTGNYAFLNSDAYGSGNSQNVDLITPTLNLSGANEVTLSFNHYFRSYSGSSGSVSYSINNGTTWTNIETFTTTSATNPVAFSQIIPAAAGQSAVKFKWNYIGTYGWYWGIDDIQVTGNCTTVPVSIVIAASANPLCAGSGVTFTATPANGGTTPAFQWKVNGNIVSGATSSTYSFQPANNDAVTCVLTSNATCVSGNPATSNTVTMVVIPYYPVSISISPSANNVCAGTPVIFTPAPVNGGTPSYQWFKNTVAVGTGSTYSYVPANGDQVFVLMTSGLMCKTGSPAVSNTVTMSVNPLLTVNVSVSSSANPVCAGTSVSFTATSTNGGANPAYQWKVNGTSVSGASNAIYAYAPASNDVVKCVLTSSTTCLSGNPATSNSITMSVNQVLPVSVTITPSANSVCSGTLVTFMATPVNGGNNPSYQWQVSGTSVTGATNSSYSFIPANGDLVSCVLTSSESCISGNPATSNLLTMVIKPLLPVGVIVVPSANPECEDNEVTFTATPINGGPTPSYQWIVDGIPIGWYFPEFYTYPVNNEVVTCILTATGECLTNNPATSDPVTMIINPWFQVGVSVNPSENPVCAGTTVTFTATPTNGGTSPEYQWYVNGTNVGASGSTYSYIPENNDVVTCLLDAVSFCSFGSPVTSAITMTVNPLLPVSVSVSPSGNPVNPGTPVTFTANAVNGGASPVFQWVVNGTNAGTNSYSYTYIPVNGDVVSCILISGETCASFTPANSNSITMRVYAGTLISNLQNIAVSGTECFSAIQTIVVAGDETSFTVDNGGSAILIAGHNILFYPGTFVEQGGYMSGYIAPEWPWCVNPPVAAVATGTGAKTHVMDSHFFRIYPNPTSGVFTLELTGLNSSEKIKIEIHNVGGAKVMSESLAGDRKNLFSLEDVPAGLYFIRVIAGDEVGTIKLIKSE